MAWIFNEHLIKMIQKNRKRIEEVADVIPDPSEATDGQVIMVDDGAYTIGNIPNELPTPTDSGQYLITDGTEYRLYPLMGIGKVLDDSISSLNSIDQLYSWLPQTLYNSYTEVPGTSGTYFIETISYGNSKIQRATRVTATGRGSMYIRFFINSTWSEWVAQVVIT